MGKDKTKRGKSRFFGGLVGAMKNGSFSTRLSVLFRGFGQIARGQLIKGLLYFLLQAAFLLFMIFFGFQYIAHLFSGDLGTKLSGEIWNEELQIFEKVKGDNSFLILLYGVATLLLIAFFVIVWTMNVKGAYENDKRLAIGERVSTIKEDVRSLLNEKFYIPLLIPPFVGLLVFTVMPLVFMVLIAFTNYDYAHTPPGKLFDWVGFVNLKRSFPFRVGRAALRSCFCAYYYGRSCGRFSQRLATIF